MVANLPIRWSLREWLAELEHRQWIEWSKNLAKTENLSEERVKRWKKLWIPYEKLSENDKDFDRVWADKVIEILTTFLIPDYILSRYVKK